MEQILGSGNRKCKCPEAGRCLPHPWKSKKATWLAKHRQEKGQKIRVRGTRSEESRRLRTLDLILNVIKKPFQDCEGRCAST